MVVEEFGDALGLHDSQRDDAGRGAEDFIKRQVRQLDEAEGEIGNKGAGVVSESGGNVQQGQEFWREFPPLGILRQHHRHDDWQVGRLGLLAQKLLPNARHILQQPQGKPAVGLALVFEEHINQAIVPGQRHGKKQVALAVAVVGIDE